MQFFIDNRTECHKNVLLQFWEAVNDAETEIVSELDLNHLGREVLADLSNFLSREFQLPPTSFDQVIDE